MTATIYWVDASVYITAKSKTYRFSIFPIFWGFLDEKLEEGTLRSPKMVYQEIVRNEEPTDDIARWFKSRRQRGLCVAATKDVQDQYKGIANYVMGKYEQAQAADFLSGADPWLVAHAMSTKGVVVTLETDQKPEAKRIRIPDVCAHFGVRCVDTVQMLEDLGAKFSSTVPSVGNSRTIRRGRSS